MYFQICRNWKVYLFQSYWKRNDLCNSETRQAANPMWIQNKHPSVCTGSLQEGVQVGGAGLILLCLCVWRSPGRLQPQALTSKPTKAGPGGFTPRLLSSHIYLDTRTGKTDGKFNEKRNQITSTGHSREVMSRSKQPNKTKGKQSSLLSAPVVGAISRISATFCGFQVTGLSSAYTQRREGYIKQILTDGRYWRNLLCKTKFAPRSNREHTWIKRNKSVMYKCEIYKPC